MATKFGMLIFKLRWVIVLLAFIIVGVMTVGFSKLRISNDYRDFFKKEDPTLIANNRFEAAFSREDSFLVAVEYSPGIFTPEYFRIIRELTDAMWQMPNISRVSSITNYQWVEGDNASIRISDFVEQIPATEEQWQSLIEKASADRTLNNLMIADNRSFTVLNAVILKPEGRADAVLESRSAIANYLDNVKLTHPELNYYIGGIAEIEYGFSHYSQKDMLILVPVMVLTILLILLVLFRSILLALLPMLIVFISIICVLGAAGFMDIAITVPSSVTPEIIITVAIAGSIHIIVTFLKKIGNGADPVEAIIKSLRNNFLPCFISAVTSAIGFYSLMVQTSPPQKYLGILAGSGVLVTFIFSIILLPALLSIIRIDTANKNTTRKQIQLGDKFNRAMAHFAIRFRKPILLISAALVVVVCWGMSIVKVDNHWYHYFGKSIGLRKSADFIDARLPAGIDYIDLAFHSGESNGIKNPAYLKKLEAFQQFLEGLPEVNYTVSIVEIIKKINRSIHNDNPEFYKIPDFKKEVSEYLFLYSLSLPMGMDLNNQIDLDYEASRITIWMNQSSAKKFMVLEKKILQWQQIHCPEANAILVGPNMMMARLSMHVIPDMLKSLSLALVAITLTMVLIYRSLKLGGVSMIPNVIPIGVAFAYMGLSMDCIDWGKSIISAISIGIVVDDTVHFITRFKSFSDAGLSREEAVYATFNETGTAIIFTSIILVAGFLILSVSSFKGNADLGFYTAMIVAAALAGDLLFVPAILVVTGDFTRKIEQRRWML